jgi:hypothetical protein
MQDCDNIIKLIKSLKGGDNKWNRKTIRSLVTLK